MSFLKKLNVDAVKDAFATGVKAAQKNLSNMDVGEMAQTAKEVATSTVKNARENISSIDAHDVVEGAKKVASSGASAVGKAVEGLTQKSPEEKEEEAPVKGLITLLWCMAYVDGVISEEERDSLKVLSISIDATYESYGDELEDAFSHKLVENGKEFGHVNAVKIEAKEIIESLELTPTDVKLLCWNLLALANSDGLEDSELDLIRYIGEQTGLEASIVEELRNYNDAIVETAKARDQLRQSNRSYGEIEPLMNELAKREQALIEAAQALISDR